MKTVIGVSKRAISIDGAIRSVMSPSAGGTAVFIGTVRRESRGMKVSSMEFEAAADLARRDLTRIANAAVSRFDLCGLSIHHRIGKLILGDVIVVIAVSAPHRKDAFAACMYVIEEIKKSTPIWKKEYGGGKQRWVEAE